MTINSDSKSSIRILSEEETMLISGGWGDTTDSGWGCPFGPPYDPWDYNYYDSFYNYNNDYDPNDPYGIGSGGTPPPPPEDVAGVGTANQGG